MISITKMRLFPMKVTAFQIPISKDESESFNIIFYPENSTFSSAYIFLRIKKMFVRMGTIIPYLRFPRLIVTAKILSVFRVLKLIPIRKKQPGNIFIDTTPFFTLIDNQFKRESYRRPIVLSKILSYLGSIRSFSEGRKTILLYYVDVSQPLSDNILERRSWAFIHILRQKESQGRLPFDYVVLALKYGGRVYYFVLSNPLKTISVSKFFTIMRSLKTIKSIDELSNVEEIENNDFSEKISDITKSEEPLGISNIEKPSDEFVKNSVSKYIKNCDPAERNNLLYKEELTDEKSHQLAIKSILTNVSGDKKKSQQIISKISPERLPSVLNNVKNIFYKESIPEDVYKNKTTDSVFEKVNIFKVNNSIDPSRVLNKRKVDFKEVFENDLKKSFSLLSRKENFPLKMVSFKKYSVPIDPGDLEPSKYIRYTVSLKDDRRKIHDVIIDIPEIQLDGTFLINGEKKFLIYQIIIDPIFFVKKDQAQFQTMYASTAVHLKRTKYKSYFEIYISGYKLPLFLLLSYYMGFQKLCQLFDIKYEIVKEEPKDKTYLQLKNGTFLILSSIRSESQILINSLKESNYQFSEENILEKNTFKDAIIKYVGNRNCIYQIDLILENIMEPISLQILKNKLLPTTFETCIAYICKELAKGRVDKRNDISHQRIRSSEVFAYQIQKLILGSYTDYMVKREHGDKDAPYYCDARAIVNDIVNSPLMRTLENINPIEELSSLTRVTPVGPGGIPDEHATTKQSRNTHESYYGNIEPNDTPEGEKVGMINQLTINALINNVRGSFSTTPLSENISTSVLSSTTSLIPYVNSCDGSRVLIASNQAKGAIPIIGEEQPLVQTGFESIMTSMLTNSYIKKSSVNGVVTKINDDVIYVQDLKSRKIDKILLLPEKLKSAQGKSALNYFKSVVKTGQKIQRGQIVAEGKHIKDGVIMTGTNLLTAIMGWKGYSFEDGFVISEKIANQKLVSESYEEIQIFIDSDDIVKFSSYQGKETIKGEPLLIRTSRSIETLIGLDEDELYEGQIIKKSPGGKIISLEIYPNISIKKFPALQEPFLQFKKKYEETRGPFPEKFYINQGGKKMAYRGIKVIFRIERYDNCIVGDKLSNLHGGKGVVTLIEKTENMPIAPWGESVDIILNPLSVINRMNPSTIYEMYTGLIAKFMAYQVVEFGNKKNSKALKLIHDVYTSLDKTKDRILSKNIINVFNSLSEKQYFDYIEKIKNNNYILPIYVPPFQQPSKEMISKALEIVNAKSRYYLNIPEYGTKTNNPVALGYLYFRKLEHQAAYKVNARSIGKYHTTTSQPVSGGKGGGQRFGEFETWCLVSHGAINVLRELMGPLSDDKKTKDEILSDIIQTGEASYKEPRKSHTKSLFDIYIHALMLEALMK